jgi:hypothetical protein
MLLNRTYISECEYYQKADPQLFDFAISVLRENHFRVSLTKNSVLRLMPTFQKAFWDASRPQLTPFYGLSKIPAYEVVHQAVHTLVAKRFSNIMAKKPKMTLFSEALAGAIEIYFATCFLQNGGNPKDCKSLLKYQQNASMLNRGYLKKFTVLAANPFEAFKQNAESAFEISTRCMQVLELSRQNKKLNLENFNRAILKHPHMPFLLHKDFPNFALYTATYCGFVSSPRDRTDLKDCKKTLHSSSSLLEFLNSLNQKTIPFSETKK